MFRVCDPEMACRRPAIQFRSTSCPFRVPTCLLQINWYSGFPLQTAKGLRSSSRACSDRGMSTSKVTGVIAPFRIYSYTPAMDHTGRLECLQKDVPRLKVDTLLITH